MSGRFYVEDYFGKKKHQGHFRKGRMGEIFDNTSEEFSEWLVNKTVNDGYESLARCINDILLDVFFEEQNKK